MDTREAVAVAVAMMEEHGLYAQGWSFEWDNSKRRAGLCDYARKVISISKPITELNDVANVRDTILHEIAHALAPRGSGHGLMWRTVARSIGCSAQRCYPRDTVLPFLRWRGTCPAGHVRTRARKPKHAWSCGVCSRKFSRDNIITWEDTKCRTTGGAR